MNRRPEFIVYAFSWDENIGGVIVLHALCARLRELGYAAAIWPSWKPKRAPRSWLSLRNWIAYFVKGRFLRRTKPSPFNLPIAHLSDVEQAVVIYPEVIAGNPLGARKVVRWLLYKPGVHSGVVDFGEDDLIVAYNRAFFPEPDLHQESEVLRVTYSVDCYRQWNFGERSGSCVIIRKGRGRRLDQHPPDAVLVDDMTHEERAAVFNRAALCYCYDLYTYFAVYAAICGCVPIIIPEPGLSEEEWEPERSHRLGLAYGEDRVNWARSSRAELLSSLDAKRAAEDASVRNFVERARAHWPV